MALLHNDLFAAAMSTFMLSLRSGCSVDGDALQGFHPDDSPSSFDLSTYLDLLDNDAVPLPAMEPSVAAPDLMAESTQQTIAPPTMAGSPFRDMLPPRLPRIEEEHRRIAFRTKSEVEILNDGFKWRKYGKKNVKNSPNPRNYYKCSTEGCSVKKRVERDNEDSSYVITTYEGFHNHNSSDIIYYATQDSVSGSFLLSGHHIHDSGSSIRSFSTYNLT